MSFDVEIETRAAAEIREASRWYEAQAPVAAENFRKEMLHQFELLKTGTVEHPKLLLHVNYFRLKIFPYSVYYIKQEKEKIIQVIAVLHNKRDPGFISKRLTPD